MISKICPSERTYPPCTGGPAPACCQPPFEERTARVERIGAHLDAVTPTRCPNCGSREIAPLFWVDVDVFDCAACCAIFSGRGD